MATGYNWKQLRNFVTSLRTTGYEGDVVLFLSKAARWDFELRERLHHYGIQIYFTTMEYPYFEEDTFLLKTAEKMSPLRPIKDMHRRFHLMAIWMEAYGSQYTHGLITDTRDVVFQIDPFDWSQFTPKEVGENGQQMQQELAIIGNRLYAFKEHLSLTLNTNEVNKGWIKGSFGEQGLALIGDQHIICSGTTMGSMTALKEYLDGMVGLTRKLLEEYPYPYFEENVFDQALHNYLLYKWANDTKEGEEGDIDIHFFENGHSPVMALGALEGSQFEGLKMDNSSYIVFNQDGRIPNIVHQYDRHETLSNGWTSVFSYLDTIQSLPFQGQLRPILNKIKS